VMTFTLLSWIIAVSLLAVQIVEWIGDVLNLRALVPTPPAGFERVYDGDRYAKSQTYTRERTRFGFVVSSVSLVTLFLFWFMGGFHVLDSWTRSWALPEIFRGLAYIGILAMGKEFLSLPFSLYGTFVIEERYGFNRTTARTFIGDRLKGYGLTVLIGGPVLALVLWLFIRWGGGAWVWGWMAVAGISLLFQFIAPTWILPLFNKFTPLEEGPLRQAIFDLARRVEFPLTNVFVMDGSKRSAKGNAFFTGFGKNKRIALFDTLIEKHTVTELTAVLAHEIGHYKKGHIWKGFALRVVQTGVLFYLLSLTLGRSELFNAFGLEQISVPAGLVLFGILFSPVSFFISLPLHAFSRRNEYEADRYAQETLGTGKDLASGLKGLSAAGLSNLTPHPFYVWLHASHPPVVDRVAALLKFSPPVKSPTVGIETLQ
jgi:STE24 endopeptidase